MSSSVGWGMLLPGETLDAAWSVLDAARPAATALIGSVKARRLAERAVEIADAAAMARRPCPAPLAAAWDEAADARRGAMPDPRWDLTFRIVLCPLGGRVYGAALVGHRDFGAFLLGLPGVEEFAWDDGEPPERLGRREWSERGRVWRAISARDPGTRLTGCGLTLDYLETHRAPEVAEILAHAPTRDARVARAARDLAIARRAAATGNDVPACVRALDWIGTAEGADALETARREADGLLRDIDERTLKGDA